MYLTREMTVSALTNMAGFYKNLRSLYLEHKMDVQDDLGRRNILMSKPQEKFFTCELTKSYPTAKSDGTTGQPDIVIPEIARELECKITSPHKDGGWFLQTDYVTLSKKGSLDYLYVLCDENFEKFAVLHFEGLTIEDFNEPNKSSRNKANIKLDSALKKCNVLLGEVEHISVEKIRVIDEKLAATPPTQKSVIRRLVHSREAWKNRNSYNFKLQRLP